MESKLSATNTPGCLVSVVHRNDQTTTTATLTSYHCATQTRQFVSSASTPEKQRQTQIEIQLNKSINISPGNSPPAHFKRLFKTFMQHNAIYYLPLSKQSDNIALPYFWKQKCSSCLTLKIKVICKVLPFSLPSTECILSYKDDGLGFLWFILKTKQLGNKLWSQ